MGNIIILQLLPWLRSTHAAPLTLFVIFEEASAWVDHQSRSVLKTKGIHQSWRPLRARLVALLLFWKVQSLIF